MPVVYSVAVKNARMTAVMNEIGSTGKIKVLNAEDTVLASIPLANPPGTVSSGVLTVDCDPAISDTSADASGIASKAVITDGSDTVVVSGLTVTATGDGGDVQFDNVNFAAGQTVLITAGAITHA